jgi:NTE family protein
MKSNAQTTNYTHIAMACQGGGSLGAYHVGALAAMSEAGYDPDVVGGISIGAFTAAIIAGNDPGRRQERLEQFWRMISWPDMPFSFDGGNWLRKWHNQMSSLQGFVFGQPAFFQPRLFSVPALQIPGSPAATSYYDTSALLETLPQVVDFDRINRRETRLILGATRVRDGMPVWFDNFQQPLGPEHVMASGAMPPGFPGVTIGGELYWDGGCYSNTPLEGIYENLCDQGDTLCFVINLFGPSGHLPQDMDDVTLTMKDIQFSNRVRNGIKAISKRHRYAYCLRQIMESHPQAIASQSQREEIGKLKKVGRFDFVQILYEKPPYEAATCDCEFSRSSIDSRIHRGYDDMKLALEDQFSRPSPRLAAGKPAPAGSMIESYKHGVLLDHRSGPVTCHLGLRARTPAHAN